MGHPEILGGAAGGERHAGWGSWSPTLAAKTKTRRGWGTRQVIWAQVAWLSPTLNAKDAFRMGHPEILGGAAGDERHAGWGSWSPTLAARTKTRRGWGTRQVIWAQVASLSPTLNAKSAFRMGHPEILGGAAGDGRHAGWGSWSPTLAAKTKTRRGWGTRQVIWAQVASLSPTLNAKSAFRMGHPAAHPFRKEREEDGAWGAFYRPRDEPEFTVRRNH